MNISGSYTKYGTIVCRADNSSYYPVSLFERENGLCEFENATNFELLDESYPKISKIASKSTNFQIMYLHILTQSNKIISNAISHQIGSSATMQR